jgi:hypothetical protein
MARRLILACVRCRLPTNARLKNGAIGVWRRRGCEVPVLFSRRSQARGGGIAWLEAYESGWMDGPFGAVVAPLPPGLAFARRVWR